MEFKIRKEEFLRGLYLAHGIADRKSTLPILANVLLRTEGKDKLLCGATDLNVSTQVTLDAKIEKEGGLTVAGELMIGSSRVRLEIPANVEQMAGGDVRLEGQTTVSRTAAGVAWNGLGMIRGDATLHARLTLERTTAPTQEPR